MYDASMHVLYTVYASTGYSKESYIKGKYKFQVETNSKDTIHMTGNAQTI